MDNAAAGAAPRPIGGLLPAERDVDTLRLGTTTRRFDVWSRDSDLVLRDLVLRKGDTNWGKVARAIEWDTGMVTAQDCKERWDEIKDTPVKGPWSSEEDEHLKRLVMEYGSKKWNLLARAFPGRSGKQCRERWHNHVDERVRKGEWTPEEDQILCKAQRQLGNKWSEMSRILTGRSENAIKNRFNSLNAKGLTEKRANELVGKMRLDLNRDFSRKTSGENSSPRSGAYENDFIDPRSQDTGRGGVYGLEGGEGTRSVVEPSGRGEGGNVALGRMKALMVAVGEERAACLDNYEDSEEERWWEKGAGGRSSARDGGGDGGRRVNRGKEVEIGDGPQQSEASLRESNMAEAEAGMSVLAQAAGLLDMEDDGSNSDNSNSTGSGGSGSGSYSYTSVGARGSAGGGSRSSGSISSASSFGGGGAVACPNRGIINGYHPAYHSVAANHPLLHQHLSYRNRSGIVDHGSTPPGSASPLTYGPFSGGTIAGDPSPCDSDGGDGRNGYGGGMTPCAFPLGEATSSASSAAAASYSGSGGSGGGGGKVSYGSGGGGVASSVSGFGSSSRSGWYVGPGGVQRRSLESVPGPWRPYWREDDDNMEVEHGGASVEPKTKRLKSEELRV